MESFKSYLERCHPLPWTVIKEHTNKWLVGNHTLAINYVRFRLIAKAIRQYIDVNDPVVLDIGVYPGIVPQLFSEYLTQIQPKDYYGIGLGFHEDFSKAMEGFGVTLLECDLEPRLHLHNGRSTSISVDDDSIDFVVFTDVIEHFYDPFYPLQEINRVCREGAVMVLTTDNLTRLVNLQGMLRGKSSNVPLIEGNLFYTGDWRPHFREYSREELFQLLKWAGFEVLEHQFYEAEFGKYHLMDGHLIKKNPENSSLKGKLKSVIRDKVVNLIPHFRDNHIIVVRKIKSYKDMVIKAPKIVNNFDEWMSQRQTFGESR